MTKPPPSLYPNTQNKSRIHGSPCTIRMVFKQGLIYKKKGSLIFFLILFRHKLKGRQSIDDTLMALNQKLSFINSIYSLLFLNFGTGRRSPPYIRNTDFHCTGEPIIGLRTSFEKPKRVFESIKRSRMQEFKSSTKKLGKREFKIL